MTANIRATCHYSDTDAFPLSYEGELILDSAALWWVLVYYEDTSSRLSVYRVVAYKERARGPRGVLIHDGEKKGLRRVSVSRRKDYSEINKALDAAIEDYTRNGGVQKDLDAKYEAFEAYEQEQKRLKETELAGGTN